MKGISRDSPDGSAALMLADRFEIVETTGRGDDCILKIALELGASVLSNDREFVRRLKESGVRVLSIRGGKKIDYV